MTDQRLRERLHQRAEEAHAEPIDYQRLWDDAHSRRRRRWVLGAGLCAAGLVGASAATALVFQGTRSSDPSPTSNRHQDNRSTVTIRTGSYDWGVYIGVDVTFGSARGLDDGYFRAGTARYPVQFWTQATDCDCEYPDPLPAHPGEKVLIEATSAIPDCSMEPADSVELVVTSRMPDGTTETDRFDAVNASAYASAVDQWCAGGPRVMTGDARVTLDGEATVHLDVTNPGPDPILVQVPEFSADGAHWDAASATVAPRETATLLLHGTGVRQNGRQPVPWEGGRLLVDGSPFPFHDPNGWI
jgi:hypothetical protein